MFRHALAQALVDTAGLHVAQEVLGHAYISTTAGTYARGDERAMGDALARGGDLFDLAAADHGLETQARAAEREYVFDYDAATLAQLDAIRPAGPPPGRAL